MPSVTNSTIIHATDLNSIRNVIETIKAKAGNGAYWNVGLSTIDALPLVAEGDIIKAEHFNDARDILDVIKNSCVCDFNCSCNTVYSNTCSCHSY